MRPEINEWITSYPKAPTLKDGSFQGSSVVRVVTTTVPDAIRNAIPSEALRYKIVGSAGKGDWTYTPWVALMDPLETSSVEEGVYIVYLLSHGCERLYLTINQGCTALKDNSGIPEARSELLRRGELIKRRVGKSSNRLKTKSIDLNTKIWRANLYEHGNIFACEYSTNSLPSNEDMVADLNEAIKLYRDILKTGASEPDDTIVSNATSELGNVTLKQAKRYRQHRRIERDPRHSKIVKKLQGTQCKGCDKDPEEVYGIIAHEMVDAHHLTPLSNLSDGNVIEFDPIKDFTVLCPNCHRAIHRMENSGDLQALRKLVKRA